MVMGLLFIMRRLMAFPAVVVWSAFVKIISQGDEQWEAIAPQLLAVANCDFYEKGIRLKTLMMPKEGKC